MKALKKPHEARPDSVRQPKPLGTGDSCWAHVWVTGPDAVSLTWEGVERPHLWHCLLKQCPHCGVGIWESSDDPSVS